jgi:uncharacterized protein (DUF488 family)
MIYTIGHSTRSLETFIGLLKAQGVTALVDVRTIPRSRHNRQFNQDTLPDALAAAGIRYVYEKGLGGLRHTKPGSPNGAWRNASFRGFADYMQTPEFAEGLNRLIEIAGTEPVAIMCAEAVPWRCHRSLIADALVVRGFSVRDVIGATSCKPHVITPWAKIDGMAITYPPESKESEAPQKSTQRRSAKPEKGTKSKNKAA